MIPAVLATLGYLLISLLFVSAYTNGVAKGKVPPPGSKSMYVFTSVLLFLLWPIIFPPSLISAILNDYRKITRKP